MGSVIRIQKELTRLLNWNDSLGKGYQNSDLWELAQFVNKLSPYEVARGPRYVLRNKKTQKEVAP